MMKTESENKNVKSVMRSMRNKISIRMGTQAGAFVL